MDAETAARRWAETWSHAWPQRDVEAIVALYADAAVHHTTPFREPGLGRAGVSVLRFDGQGQVIKHRDYDHHVEGRQRPYTD